MMSSTHERMGLGENIISLEVRYSDVDLMGVVHNVKYFEYFELSRLAFLKQYVCSYDELRREHAVELPVLSTSAEFYKGARFDDLLVVKCMAKEVTVRRLVFEYEVLRGAEVLCRGLSKHACIRLGVFKSVDLPGFFLERLGLALVSE